MASSRSVVTLAALAAIGIGAADRHSRRVEPYGYEYRRPGGHASAKEAARANRRRKLEKQTRKAQRRNR